MVSEKVNGGMGGEVVLITGGTSGIGKAAALAAMGAEVVAHQRQSRVVELAGFVEKKYRTGGLMREHTV